MACSDLVVIRYLSCVSRRSILITFPHGLVLWTSYNNWPGYSNNGAGLDSDPLLWEGFRLDWVAVGFHSWGWFAFSPFFLSILLSIFLSILQSFFTLHIYFFYSPIFSRCVVVTCRWFVCYCHVALVNCFCVVLFCGM